MNCQQFEKAVSGGGCSKSLFGEKCNGQTGDRIELLKAAWFFCLATTAE